jgi:hypothetical protein
MPSTRELGTRIELVSMDLHCHEITLGLYQQGHEFLIHSYSSHPDVPGRLAFLRDAAVILGGLVQSNGQLTFPCGTIHKAAVRRIFLESAKLATGADLSPKPLTIFDKKSSQEIVVRSLGSGRYEVIADGPRVEAITNGLKKLGELEESGPGVVAFPCGQSHDDLIGLLLPRALNVRAILREEESVASRGVLVAPSAQK